MSSIITGLFKSQNQSHAIATDLENAGFQDSDFIVYLHDKQITKEVKTSICQSLFKEKRELEDDSLVVSVKVKDAHQIENAKEVFLKNNSIHQNYFENVKFSDTMSLQYLKRMVSLRARSEIFSPLKINQRDPSAGINSEVVFGKS